MMTKEKYDALKRFERDFRNSRQGFYRMCSRDFNELLEIFYGPTYKALVPKGTFSCSYCKLKEVKKIGDEWFAYVPEPEPEPEPEPTPKKPKKKTSKKDGSTGIRQDKDQK